MVFKMMLLLSCLQSRGLQIFDSLLYEEGGNKSFTSAGLQKGDNVFFAGALEQLDLVAAGDEVEGLV